jgi:hypothetical protein
MYSLRYSWVQWLSMKRKPTPMPLPSARREPPNASRRVIFSIGRQRFALELHSLHSTVTELNQEPARVIPINRKRNP